MQMVKMPRIYGDGPGASEYELPWKLWWIDYKGDGEMKTGYEDDFGFAWCKFAAFLARSKWSENI